MSLLGAFPQDNAADVALNEKFEDKHKKKGKSGGFEAMDLEPAVFGAVKKMGFHVPTPIQRKAIPLLMANLDVLATARTGSGKTAAFVIPMLTRLREHERTVGVRAFLLSPTRELALQTADVVRKLAMLTDLRACLLVGGDAIEQQFTDLSTNPDIVIATPGRLMQVLVETDMNLRSVEFVCFDEADRLFEMGFESQMREFLNRLPPRRQTCLFSATLPDALVSFARAGLRDPQLVRLDSDVHVSDNLSMAFFVCRPLEKRAALLWLLQNHLDPDARQTLVFAATKFMVEYLTELVNEAGYEAACIYGAMDPTQRKINLARFRNKGLHVLCVTDVAARGLDVPLLDYVVNFDIAATPKTFVHRVGRVARNGRTGTAFNIVSSDEIANMLDLGVFLGRRLVAAPVNGVKDPEYRLNADVSHLGRIPQVALANTQEMIVSAHKRRSDLKGMLKTATNAYKMVVETRPHASKSSIRRAKLLSVDGLHPLSFMGESQDDAALEMMRSAMINNMRNFRPKQTVFEVSTQASVAKDIMQRKRDQHTSLIVKRETNNDVAEELVKEEELKREGNDGDDDDDVKSEPSSDEDANMDFWTQDDQGSDLGDASSSEDKPDAASVASKPRIPLYNSNKPLNKRQRRRQRLLEQRDSRRDKKKSGKSYQDPNFFMAYQQQQTGDFRALTVDEEDAPKPLIKGVVALNTVSLSGDAAAHMIDDSSKEGSRRTMRKWDRRKKKYIEVGVGVDPNDFSQQGKRMRLDNGLSVKMTSLGKYKEWKEKSHMRIGETGEDEDELVKRGTIASNPFKNGLPVKGGRVVTGRGRASLPQLGAVVDPVTGEVSGGVSKELLQAVAKSGGDLKPMAQVAKERVVNEFRRIRAKSGINRARQVVNGEKEETIEALRKRQRFSKSTKKGFGAATKKEFVRNFGKRKTRAY